MRCRSKGYTGSFGSMCRQIRSKGYRKPKIHRKSYTNYNRLDGKYPGHKVQVDIKYVPNECIRFPCYGQRYCQITAIDEYSRKRVLKIVKEKSSCETGKFLQSPEKKMGFKISIIRADNGTEFVNDEDRYNRTAKTSLDFKSPDRVVGEYFSKCNNVLTIKNYCRWLKKKGCFAVDAVVYYMSCRINRIDRVRSCSKYAKALPEQERGEKA